MLPNVQSLGAWYDEYFGYIAANADVVRAAAYVNADWDAIQQFACPPGTSAGQPNCTDGYWGNSRIQDNPTIRAGAEREWQNAIYVNGTLAGRGTDWGSGVPPTAPPPAGPLPNGRLLLIGQSTRAAWDDYTRAAQPPAGGSVYYELRSGAFVGPAHRQYAEFLAGQGKVVQIGISWKDNPPGFTGGDENAKAARSRAVTAEPAAGQYTGQLTRLTDFIRSHPAAHYLLWLDYEVSSSYHCATPDCASSKGAFARLRATIAGATPGVDVKFVHHPVRGGPAVPQSLHRPGPVRQPGRDLAQLGLRRERAADDEAQQGPRQADDRVGGGADELHRRRERHQRPGAGGVAGLGPPVLRSHGLLRPAAQHTEGTYDLSGVIRAATYIDLDFRYGWDGIDDGSFDFPVNSTWFVDGRLSRYDGARQDFCGGLSARGFSSGC